MKFSQLTATAFACLLLTSSALFAAPEYYTNPPENLNPDPDYVPGDYPLPDMTAALARYDADKNALMARVKTPADGVFLAETDGELMATVMKNETAPVLGTFRDFNGYFSFRGGQFSEARLVISVNSWDSGIPGRDARIRSIFFQSMMAHFATATLTLDRILEGDAEQAKLQDGQVHTVTANGTITLGGMTVTVKPRIHVRWDIGIWWVESAEPLEVLISDFGLGSNVLPLMIECNHKSIRNRVALEWSLAFAEPEPPETE